MARRANEAKGWAALVILAVAAPIVAVGQCREHAAATQTHTVTFRVSGPPTCRGSVEVSLNSMPTFTDASLPWQSAPMQITGTETVSVSAEFRLDCPGPPDAIVCAIDLDGHPWRRVAGWVSGTHMAGVYGIGCGASGAIGREEPEPGPPSERQRQGAQEMFARWQEARAREEQRQRAVASPDAAAPHTHPSRHSGRH